MTLTKRPGTVGVSGTAADFRQKINRINDYFYGEEMNFRKTLIAASLAAIPMMMCAEAMATKPMMGAPVFDDAMAKASLIGKLKAAADKRGLDIDHGYWVAAEHPGVAGTKISRVAHTYKGVRVFHSESVLVTNANGKIISESVDDRRNGLGYGASAAGMGGRYSSFNVQPSISAAAAINSVVATMAPDATHAAKPNAELIIYPIVTQVRVPSAVNKIESQLNAIDLEEQVTGYELAYLVETRMVVGGTDPVFYDTVVSANDGHVIKQWNTLKTVVGTGNSQYNGAVPISTTLSGSTYSMKDATRGIGGTFGAMAITNANHTT
ncbi:MAG: bacillolysin family protein, partial [Massilia sp.]|nr:bacillolysin family protein [Massilia sp.]